MSNLLDALYSNAWAITDGKIRDIEAMLQRHSAGVSLPDHKIQEIVDQNDTASFEGLSDFDQITSGGYLRKGDTAYVPIHGTIVSRAGFIAKASGAVSPQAVQERLRSAAADEEVERIVLDIDSPGGTVAGTIPTANTVARVAEDKEVVAVGENMIASAAYWIGSHADRLIVGEGAQVGSIGVIAVHRDHTGKLEEEGIESTIVRVQGDKALGHPEEAFSDEAREVWEERLKGYYDLFTEAVARSMGIPEDDLRSEIGSRSYMGRDAVEAGLADQIGSLAAVLRSSNTYEPKDNQFTMSDANEESAEKSVQDRIEALEARLEAEEQRAEQAEAQAEKAAQLAEQQSEALAEQRRDSVRQEATSLVDDEIIGKGKAKQSQRDSLLAECTDEGGNYDSSRISLVRTMYQGIAEGSAVPVNGAGISDEANRSDEDAASDVEDYDIRQDLVSNLPSRHRQTVAR